MRFLVAALLLSLGACASAPAPKVAATPVDTNTCPTVTVDEFKQVMTKLPEMEALDGEKAKVFMALVNSAGPLKLDQADSVLVAHDSKLFLAGFFLDGCAVAHVAGSWKAIEKFFGQKV